MENFKEYLLDALQDNDVIDRYRLIFELIFKSLLDPFTKKVTENIKSMNQTITALQKESQEKDKKIQDLEKDVSELKSIIDNHEQHGRRDYIRILGLSENTPGTTDAKVMRLCNQRMKLVPPLSIAEISVSHRLGKPIEPTDNSPPPPRPLLVKFATRRSKNRVMAAKKTLRQTEDQPDTVDTESNDDVDVMADGVKIYLADDLTKARAYLAYRARQEKRKNKIMDTWVIDAKVMIKDNHSRITQVTSIDHLMSKVN